MGKELSILPLTTSNDAITRKNTLHLWLHDIIDNVITPGLITIENLTISMHTLLSDGFDELYAAPINALEERVEDLEAGGGGAIIGEVRMCTALIAPSKWLLCDGAAIARTTYASLFAVINTTYGVGDGSTTFNIPDFRGRTAVGAGQGSGLTNRALGDALGEEAHANTSAENGPHTHTGPSHTHTMAHTHTGGEHTHPIATSQNSDNGGRVNCGGAGSTGTSARTGSGGVVTTSAASTSTTSSSGTGNTGSSGSGTAHNTMQPSLVVNYIIYTGVIES